MTQTATVLILGARGRFGSAAVRAFARAGWQVHAQMRPGASGPAIAGVTWLAAEPGDTALLAVAARDATGVVQGLSPAYTHKAWRKDMRGLTQAAIDVTRALAGAEPPQAGDAPSRGRAQPVGASVPTLMLPASVYNFGETMPALLREDTAQVASTFKGRMRIASEAQVRAATQDGRMNAVVIRGGDFFGSGSGSWLDEVMVKAMRAAPTDRHLIVLPLFHAGAQLHAFLPMLLVGGSIALIERFSAGRFVDQAIRHQATLADSQGSRTSTR